MMKTRYRIRKHGMYKDGSPRYYVQLLRKEKLVKSYALNPKKIFNLMHKNNEKK